VANPEVDDALQLFPQRAPVLGFKVERVDVLILFGRILGILHAAVGTVLEPERMGLDIGMVRRALKCEVESDLDAQFARFRQ
jgi:hypothetical protein